MPILRSVVLIFSVFFLSRSFVVFAQEASYGPKVRWVAEVENELAGLEKAYPNQIGLYIKRLSDKTFVSHRGEELFYLSSGVKLPVAIEVLRQVDAKKLELDTKLTVGPEDYVDGQGSTNLVKPGTLLTVRYLLEQMMVYNDNTANDVLIKRVGIEPINTYLQQLVPSGFERITSISEIRKKTYAEIHPSAKSLKSVDLLELNNLDDTQKVAKVREILKLKEADLLCQDISQAFNKLYGSYLNSATMKSYVLLLEQLTAGSILTTESQKLLLDLMKSSNLGSDRLIAGLPKDVHFAHKSGTQRARLCDFGVAWKGEKATVDNSVIITMCIRDYSNKELAEAVFRKVTETLTLADVFK